MYPAPMAMSPEVHALLERELSKPPGLKAPGHRHWRAARRRFREAARRG